MHFLGGGGTCWAFLFPAPALRTRCHELPNAAKIVDETKASERADLLPRTRLSRRVSLAGVSWGAAPEVKALNSYSALSVAGREARLCWAACSGDQDLAPGPPVCRRALVEVIANPDKFHFLFPITDRQPEGFVFHFLKNKVQLNLYFLLAWVLL